MGGGRSRTGATAGAGARGLARRRSGVSAEESVDVGPRNYQMKNNTAFYSMHLRVRVDRAARRGRRAPGV